VALSSHDRPRRHSRASAPTGAPNGVISPLISKGPAASTRAVARGDAKDVPVANRRQWRMDDLGRLYTLQP
jgi:hypothetical protein